MEQGQQPAGPAFGRKVFFLNPSFSVRTHIITLLRVLEYEVYTISDYRRVKCYLRVHHDAVLFINTESQLHIPAWQNLIKSIKQDSVFNSTIIGVVNEHLSPTELKLLTEDPNITGGVFHLEGQFKAILPTIERKLNDLGAKGRRQYVRTICMNDTSARFLWIQDGKLFTAQIVDISCCFDYAKGTTLRTGTGRNLCNHSAGTKADSNKGKSPCCQTERKQLCGNLYHK